jgi:hypothetical protein
LEDRARHCNQPVTDERATSSMHPKGEKPFVPGDNDVLRCAGEEPALDPSGGRSFQTLGFLLVKIEVPRDGARATGRVANPRDPGVRGWLPGRRFAAVWGEAPGQSNKHGDNAGFSTTALGQ